MDEIFKPLHYGKSVYTLKILIREISGFKLMKAIDGIQTKRIDDAIDMFKESDTEEARKQGELLEKLVQGNPVQYDKIFRNVVFGVLEGVFRLYEDKLRDEYGLRIDTSFVATVETLRPPPEYEPLKFNFINHGIKVFSTNPDMKRYATLLVKQPLQTGSDKYMAWVFKIHEDNNLDFVWKYTHYDEDNHYMFHFAYILKDHFEMWHLPD